MRLIATVLLTAAATTGFLAHAAAPGPNTNTPSAAPKTPVKSTDLFGDIVVAKGDGFEIKRSELDEEVIRRKAAMAGYGQTVPPDQMDLLERQALEQMIGFRLLLSKATDADKAAGKAQFEKTLKSYKTDRKLTDEEFDQKLGPQLRMQGVTREQWDKQQIEQATVPIVLERVLKITVSTNDAKKFYNDNPAKFEEPEKVRVSHVLISTKDPADLSPDPSAKKDLPPEKKEAKYKIAEDVDKRAKAGENFTKLVKEFSDDPSVKQNNGEYTFSRADPFVPEFKSAAFSLTNNQVSDIVTTVYGYHVLKLDEKIPAHKVEFDKVITNITDYLKQQSMQKQLPDYLEKTKADAKVEIVDEKLKAINIPTPTEPAPTLKAPGK